jgi:hypothetical protein
MMGTDYLAEINEKRRLRAKKLGVDHLICSIFFTEGLRNYASWSQDADWECPSISEVRESKQLGSVGFSLRGRRYSIHTEDDISSATSDTATTRIKLNLLLDGNLVLAETVEHRRVQDVDVYSPHRVIEFTEGEWIRDFRDLQREMKQVARRNLRRIQKERAQSRRSGSRLGKIWRALTG